VWIAMNAACSPLRSCSAYSVEFADGRHERSSLTCENAPSCWERGGPAAVSAVLHAVLCCSAVCMLLG
jgi:hypothetical protein